MHGSDKYEALIGLTGSGTVEVKIYLPNSFEIPAAERELVFEIVDAVERFRQYSNKANRFRDAGINSK